MLQWHDILALMDIELIHKLCKDNVVPNVLTWKKKYQDEKVINVTQALKTMLIGESDLDRRWKESCVNDHLAQHYFEELRHKHKMRGISLKDRLLKWKQSRVYVPVGKLRIKVLEELHNVSMVNIKVKRPFTQSKVRVFTSPRWRKMWNITFAHAWNAKAWSQYIRRNMDYINLCLF